MIEIEKEHLEELYYWRKSALEKTNETDREYHRHMIYGWYVGNYPEDDVLLTQLEDAYKNKDYALMQQIFFTYNKRTLSWYLGSGYDHCSLVYGMIPYLCCADYDEIYRAFPENLPLAANGHSMLVNATALLQCILYKGNYDNKKVITKAEKYIISKQPRWDRAYVACFLAILTEDDKMLSESLQVLCEYLSRQSISGFMKFQCQYAYGLLVFAKNNLPGNVFQKIKLPEYKTFDPGYMEWVYVGQLVRQSIYDYKAPFEELKLVYEMPLPITVLHQPYLNTENVYVSSQQKKAYYMDEDKMDEQVVDYVMKRV